MSSVLLPQIVRLAAPSRAAPWAQASCAFSTATRRWSHENPLGLPRTSSTPPNLAARMKRGLPEKQPIPGVKHVIAVTSAKGGVGKSTLAVNLALAFARQGLHAGILDTDIYGPSIPTLLNLENHEPALDASNRLVPLSAYGLKAMSMGFLVPPDRAVAWRGLLIGKALQQLLYEVAWPNLDVLVLDLPPGTGDVPLTILQRVPLAGVALISTPQTLALRDVVRGLQMFRTMDVRILGLIQNMSSFVCPGCGGVHAIFGKDGAQNACRDLNIDFLGDVPLEARVCADADAGKPTMVAAAAASSAESGAKDGLEGSLSAQAFMRIAEGIRGKAGF